MSERSYRIRTDVTKDKVVRVKAEQDYDFLEILSLKINQEDAYRLHTSNYGVIIGRVLANDAFGIPNARVSVFIELDDEDKMNSEITNIYPYTSFQSVDADGRRYNLLPDVTTDDCYQVVGTFPNKRLVLDDDTYLEVFDKYWKYTTVTNKSGDYMIFGVPKGNCQIHVDIDLSDIGILSQKPIDFMYKGYNETQFENAKQFKSGNNLDNLSQLLSQNQSVHVYPFWGDENLEEIAISRCDIQVQYKFEPTCVFFGAIMTDNYNNNIGHKCSASKYAGFNRYLVTGEGVIEMIRKTPDNLVEEFQIQGNRLIDGDGVWCYQIPMNLDFIGTDEFGNIVPTDDPKKGIPTRTSVRFRVSMQETGNEGVSRHRAKYLIPNVQDIVPSGGGNASKPYIKSGKAFERCYEFGSATPDEYYRDLYWNKVYSVKNYIPRLQTNNKASTQNYSAIRTVNSNNDVNPVPYNHARYRLSFAYRVLCIIMQVVFSVLCAINAIVSGIANIKIVGWRPFKWFCSLVGCIGVSGGLTEDEDSNKEYFPCCSYDKCADCKNKGCTKETSYDDLINVVQQSLSQEYDTVNLDFYNDWLNGSLYMPLWFWKKTKKRKFFFGLFSKKAVNSFCSCSKNFPKLRVTQNCSLAYNANSYGYTNGDKEKKYHEIFPSEKSFTVFGVIKEFVNKAGLNIYYYAPGIPNDPNYRELDEKTPYIRLYSTDIILLGSLNSCDLDNYPNVFTNLPTTTANIPFIATITQTVTEEAGAVVIDGVTEVDGLVEVTGMDWLHKPERYTPKYGAGLFMDLACTAVYTKPKSCTNIERLCELGVSLDTHMEQTVARNGNLQTNIILADGMITRYELVDNETRAMFASLNNNGFKEKIYNPNTGYYTYKLRYTYPTDFDGHMAQAEEYTKMLDIPTYDNPDDAYIEFRFGPNYDTGTTEFTTQNLIKYFYSSEKSGQWSFPLFNNSFYFYFGIHEGSTAIDKFNSRFYATCYKNEKYPFTLTIETEPAKWCPATDKDYAGIKITLNGISLPYSYTLYNEFNEVILQEDGMTTTELNFGYSVKADGGEYIYTEKTVDGKTVKELVKNGVFTEFITGEKIKNADGHNVLVTNGAYKIEITDVNGNKLTQNITVEQSPINVSYETVDLGDKYYNSTISRAQDFCNQNQFFGELRITKISIDGKDYTVNLGNVTEISDGEFDINLTATECVYMKITPQQDEEATSITLTDCSCNGVGGYGKVMQLSPSGIVFPIWRPSTFTIEVTQRCPCGGELNDNTTTVVAVVKNGQTFNAYVNEMPMKFILGKNEQPNNYNTNFYKVGATTPKAIPGWFEAHKESAFKFSATTMTYEDIWSDFVNVAREQNPNNPNDSKYYLTTETIYNILQYKFEKIFKFAKEAYVCGSQGNKMNITHTGGKSPIMYRCYSPAYTEITSEYSPNTQMQMKRFASDGTITLASEFPNIVGNNYTYYDEETDRYLLMGGKIKEPYFNTIYSNYKNMGNYLAAFTRNGGVSVEMINGEETCVHRPNQIKYQQIPYMANPVPFSDYICPNADEEFETSDYEPVIIRGGNTYKPYFRGEFVDRRLDYDFFIFTPYGGEDSPIISTSDSTYKELENGTVREPLWKKGRLSGNTLNGVEMAYNKNYEVIGYYLNKSGTSILFDKSYLLEYYYGPASSNAVNCLQQYQTDKDFKNLYQCITGTAINLGMMLTGYTEYQDTDIVTYHNKDVKFKRFYNTSLKCGNKKYDIKDYFWAANQDLLTNKLVVGRNPASFGVPIVEVGTREQNLPLNAINNLFTYNHDKIDGDDKDMYNADFDINNYPMKRLLDVGNINSCEKLTFSCSSCSYEIDVNTEDVDETIFVTGSTEECDETEFVIDCRNMINPVDTSLEECAANRTYNVLFKYDMNGCIAEKLKLKCKIKNDTYNSTHSSVSYVPMLVSVRKSGDTSDINRITNVKHNCKTTDELKKEISGMTIAYFGWDSSTVKDIKKQTKMIAPLQFAQSKYWVLSSDTNKIAYDDNVNVKNVVYTLNDTKLKDNEILGVFLERHYFNNSGDNLYKKITTFQFTSIYDVRKFRIKLDCAGKVTYNSTKVESDTTVGGGTVSVPSIGTDTNGNLTSNGSTNATVGGITGATENTAVTRTQRTIYRIDTYIGEDKNTLIKWNQQLYSINNEDGTYNTDALTAVFAIDGKFTSDVTISNSVSNSGDYLHIDFDIYWSGDLTGYYLEDVQTKEARLYIKMINKLVYAIPFKIKDLQPNRTDCEDNRETITSTTGTTGTTPPSIVKSIKIANNLPMEGSKVIRIEDGGDEYGLGKGKEQVTKVTSETTDSLYYINVFVPKECVLSGGMLANGPLVGIHFIVEGTNLKTADILEGCGGMDSQPEGVRWYPTTTEANTGKSSITYFNDEKKIIISIQIVES